MVPPTVVAADDGTTETEVGTLAAAETFTDAVHEKPDDGALVVVPTSAAATSTPVPVVSAPSGILAPAAWTADGIEDALTVPVPETIPELWVAVEPLPLIVPIVEVQ